MNKGVIESRLAPKPPMGWNSWNAFGDTVSAAVIRETADAMLESGMLERGYQYIVIDDFWHGGRDAKGYLYPHPERFPDGMKAVADYVHEKGFRFGMYSCAGTMTCGEQPGSHRYEEKDAERFAEWDIDFLKYDYCFAPPDLKTAMRRYRKMASALQATKRDIVFSVCEWGVRAPWLWAREAGGHLWRTTFDVADQWDSRGKHGTTVGILAAIDLMKGLEIFAGPGGWNDPDMLVVGLNNTGYIKGGGCSVEEYRTQMSMWCMFSAPLMATCDVRYMNPNTLDILLNPDIIAVNQDDNGKPAFHARRTPVMDVWAKPLSGQRWALAFLNRDGQSQDVMVDWTDFGIDPTTPLMLHDVWTKEQRGTHTERIAVEVPPHGTVVLVGTPPTA